MATITTSTANTAFSQAFGYPPNTMMDVNIVTGDLWMVCRTTGTQISVFKSIDKGVSWGSQGSFTVTNLHDVCAMRVDAKGENVHLVYFINDGVDKVYYKRIAILSGAADLSTGVTLWSLGGGTSTPQSFLIGAEILPICNVDGSYTIILSRTAHGGTSGATFYAITVKNDAARTTFNNNGLLVSKRSYMVSGDDGSVTVNLEVEHNGNGITAGTPNVWASWQVFGVVYCLKMTFQGYKTGWTMPASPYTVATGRSTVRDVPSRWDGARFLVTSTNPTDTTKMDVYERPVSNSGSSTKRTSPSHTIGAIGANAITYNHVTQDFRIYAVSGSGSIYSVDYTRATNTWGAWTLVSATAPLVSEWGVRRGTAGTYQYDLYVETGGASPWTITNLIQTVNFAPTAPTWLTGIAGTVTVDGAAFDVSQSLFLDWTFNDPNTTDTQGSFALSRQIGAAAIQYYRISDNTWQVAEVQNASATTSRTLTTVQWLGAGGATDPAHVYKVKTWDAAGLPSAYSAGLSVIPSTRVDPTLTAPAGGAILNTGALGVTWTVTEQSAYNIVLTNTATGAIVHDSGFLADPTPLTPSILSYTVPDILADGFAGSVALITKNAEGLSSVTRTAAFTIDFVEPVTPVVSVLAADPASGGIDVAVTQAAPSGAQPSTTQLDIWHRVAAITTPVNANPYFETNANDWTNSNYSTIARSTAQFHTGVASLLLTPTGAAATPKVQTTALYPVTAGTRWEVRVWLRSTTTNKTMRIYIDWYNVGGTIISSTTRDMTPVAGIWVYGQTSGTAPDLTTQARIAFGQLATPAAGDTLHIDEAVFIQANDDPGIRIVSGATSAVTYLDWRTVTGINYEYRGYAEAANGTTTYGAWVV